MFEFLKEEEKIALIALIAVSFSSEYTSCLNSEPSDELIKATWSYEILCKFAETLGIDEAFVDVYSPIPFWKHDSAVNDSDRNNELLAPYMQQYDFFQAAKCRILIHSLMMLLVQGKYDGRGRVLVRNMRKRLNITKAEMVSIEAHTAMCLADFQNAISHKVDKPDKQSKLIRYGKIGVAAVGVGAVLALSGGLAAPAIAAALLVMGSSTAAAAASVGAMAALFGGTGAGLTGYKMMKRTRGLTEFEFEQHDKNGQLVALIMVSGWLEDGEDYKRVIGILPDNLSFRERLVRFYDKYCPERLETIEEELEIYQDNPDQLYAKLTTMFGVDPRVSDNLVPPYPDVEFNEDFNFNINQCIEANISDISTIKDKHKKEASDAADKREAERKEEERRAEEKERNPGMVKTASKAASSAASSASKTVGNVASASYSTASSAVGSASSAVGSVASASYSSVKKLGGGMAGMLGFRRKSVEENPSIVAGETGQQKLSPKPSAAAPAVSPPQQQVAAESPTSTDFQEITDPELEPEATSTAVMEEVSLQEGGDSAALVAAAKKEQEENDNTDHIFNHNYWHWRELDMAPMYELYLLRWEIKLQKDLGQSIMAMLKSLSSDAVQNVLAATVLTSLATAVMWPALLLKLTDVIDNLWTIAIERADEAGKELAMALLKRPPGSKPVTLVGYSVGARVIFTCLKELTKIHKKLRERAEKGDQQKEEEASKRGSMFSSFVGSPRSATAAGDGAAASAGSDAEQGKFTAHHEGGGGAAAGEGYGVEGNEFNEEEDVEFDDDSSSEEGSLFEGFDEASSSQQKSDKHSGGSDAAGAAAAAQQKPKRMFFFSGGRKKKAAAEDDRIDLNNINARDLRGIVQDVVLLGAPVNLKSRHWTPIRELVAGRIVNGYSRKDLVLAIIYRYSRFKISVCGIAPTSVPGIENIDLSHLVDKHVDYCRKMKDILEHIDLSSGNPHPTAILEQLSSKVSSL